MAPDAIFEVMQTMTPDPNGRLYIGQGEKVERFENLLHQYFDTKETPLTINSATSGLDLALHMLRVGYDDEVITTPITCTATNSPIVNRKADPVWADVDPLTGLIDPRDVARKITYSTKAIVAVNWGGLQPDYAALKSFGIPVIEDAAHGPYYSTKPRGDYIVWSFQAIKFLTTGDGGAIITPDQDRARLLRWYGLDRRSSKDFRCEQNIQEAGYKYHMNDIAAAIGIANIKDLDAIMAKHATNARYYSETIKPGRHIVHVPRYNPDHPYWIYTILVDDVGLFTAHMKDANIAVSPVHARNDKHNAFFYPNGPLPGVDYFDRHQVSIPVGWWLTPKDVEHVANTVNSFFHH